VPRYNVTGEGAAPSHSGDFAMTATTTRNAIARTEHPHVIKGGGLGGQPRIDDQRISVLQLYDLYRTGMGVEEIRLSYPTLSVAEVLDALSYAFDHLDEMATWRDNLKLRNLLRGHNMAYVGGRLIPREALATMDIPVKIEVYTWETLPEELDE
jgi:uncharacterized protein (DUF433 family)